MPAKEYVLGLSISDRGIQAIELEREGLAMTLLAIDEWENTFPFDGANGDPAKLQQFQEYLAAFLKVNRVRARKACVALDTARLFLHSLPLEEGIPRPKVAEHLQWEISLFHPDIPPRDFITDIHVLKEHKQEHWNDVLSVSVLRRDVDAIRQALLQAGLQMDILDADHFSADEALRRNYPDTYRKFLALVGVKENRLDISLIRNGYLEAYRYLLVQSNKEIVEQIGRLSRETAGIYSVTVYGPYLDKDLLVQIRRGASLLVEALNPLRHINVSDSLRLADHLSVPSYRFASAVGAALRQD
jgi:Tfp pilus assembly PilM family ATPase